MVKLKPCPFCGNTKIETQSGTNVDCNTQYNGKIVYCTNCGTFRHVERHRDWNTRTDNGVQKAVELLERIANENHTYGFISFETNKAAQQFLKNYKEAIND